MVECTDSGWTRRGLLRTGAGGAVGAAVAAGGAGTAAAQDSPYDGYLSNVGNYDGTTVDMTGQSEVTVTVGAQGNGAAFAFGPAAIQVDPGTTVVWEWTGAGGNHNVVDEGGAFESDLVGDSGFTFEYAFDEAGVFKYFCRPHEGIGMKGVVAVGDTAEGEVGQPTGDSGGGGGGGAESGSGRGDAESGSGGGGSGDSTGSGDAGSESAGGDGGGGDGSGTAANQLAAQTLVAMLVLGFLSPLLFLVLIRRQASGLP